MRFMPRAARDLAVYLSLPWQELRGLRDWLRSLSEIAALTHVRRISPQWIYPLDFSRFAIDDLA